MPWKEEAILNPDNNKIAPSEKTAVFNFISEQENQVDPPSLSFMDELTGQQETPDFNTSFIDDPYEDPFLNNTEKLTEPTDNKASPSIPPEEEMISLNHPSIETASKCVEEPYYTFWPSPVESNNSSDSSTDDENVTLDDDDNSTINTTIKKPTYDEPQIKKQKTNKIVKRLRAPFEEKMKVVGMADNNPNWSLMTIKRMSKCKQLRNNDQISIWREQIENGGTIKDKINIINAAVYDRFVKFKKTKKRVNNSMLTKWALEAKKTALPLKYQLFKFVASDRWRLSFKKMYNITGHYTNLVIKSDSDQNQEINKGNSLKIIKNMIKVFFYCCVFFCFFILIVLDFHQEKEDNVQMFLINIDNIVIIKR